MAFFEHIQRASFAGLEFPVVSVQTSGGHEFASRAGYRQRGQANEHTGERARSGSLRCAIFDDLDEWPAVLYPTLRDQLVATISANPVGTLVHPTFGTFTAAINSWSESASPEELSGVWFEIHWTEELTTLNTPNPDPLVAPTAGARDVEDAAETASAQMAAVDGATGYNDLSSIATQLAFLEESERTYTEAAHAFDSMVSAVEQNLADARFAAVAAHDAVVALERTRAAILAYRDVYLDSFRVVGEYETITEMALWEVSLVTFGDTDHTVALRALNAFPDESRIPAGTRVVLPPAEF